MARQWLTLRAACHHPGATLLLTTRIKDLLRGTHKCVHFGPMPQDEAIEMLLQAGGVARAPSDPVPEAAVEAVKLCGYLPLSLSLAAAMLQEHADDWTEALVPLLRGDNRAELREFVLDEDDESGLTTESRIITSSLDLLRAKRQHGPAVLLGIFAVFAEDVIVPAVVLRAGFTCRPHLVESGTLFEGRAAGRSSFLAAPAL